MRQCTQRNKTALKNKFVFVPHGVRLFVHCCFVRSRAWLPKGKLPPVKRKGNSCLILDRKSSWIRRSNTTKISAKIYRWKFVSLVISPWFGVFPNHISSVDVILFKNIKNKVRFWIWMLLCYSSHMFSLILCGVLFWIPYICGTISQLNTKDNF